MSEDNWSNSNSGDFRRNITIDDYTLLANKHPNFCFRSTLDLDTTLHLKKLQVGKRLSQFINEAIGHYMWYRKTPKGVLLHMIQENFELAKHILRQVGAAREEAAK